eukprot:8537636-Pyramimonas_sp.AAC.1
MPGGDNYMCATDFAKYNINAAKVCYELCCPPFDVVERPPGAGASAAPPPPPMAPPPPANAPMPKPPGAEGPMISD